MLSDLYKSKTRFLPSRKNVGDGHGKQPPSSRAMLRHSKGQIMSSNEIPEHIQKPHIRRVHPIPGQDQSGRPIVQLRDPFMLARDRMLGVPVQAMQAIQMFDGEHTLQEIADSIKRTLADIETLARNMDEAGLLWGPRSEALEASLKQELERMGHLPMRHSRVLGETEEDARTKLREWMHQTEDPEITGVIRGLVVPRLDFNALYPVYAGAYHTVLNQKIDHVLILGCNQSGLGEGVILTQLGLQSPLGILPADADFIEALTDRLGKDCLRDELDHMTEHGPEMQAPWIQDCLSEPTPVTVALVPDPLTQPADQSGDLVSNKAFAEAVREVIGTIGGRTLVLAAVDLSSVGPQVGEPRPVDDQRRFDVERHDREMLGTFSNGDPDGFLDEARRTRNPTRWSGIGPMSTLLEILEDAQVELIDYRQMMLDDKGSAMISEACLSIT